MSKKSGIDKFLQGDYEVKHKTIKTGQHFKDKNGVLYTVFSTPVVSTKDGKELKLVRWDNFSSLSLGKENLITYLNIFETDLVKLEFANDVMPLATLTSGTMLEMSGGDNWIVCDHGQLVGCVLNLTKYESYAKIDREIQKLFFDSIKQWKLNIVEV